MTTQNSQSLFHWHYDELDDKNFQVKGRTLFFIIILFSVVILITLIFLYVRWICRFSSTAAAVADTATLAPQQGRPLSRTQGLAKAEIDSLPITLHQRPLSGGDAECCICLGVIEEGEKVKVLPNCLHGYHCECVDKWLMTHSSCPICRAALRVDSLV